MSAPYVSIIIPSFNSGNHLPQCLKSIIAQSYGSFEIIIVDDGSNDNTVEVIHEISMSEPRIKLFLNRKNRGPSFSRNLGIEKSIGDYLLFVDSDDEMMPNALESLVSLANRNHPDLICFDFVPSADGKTLQRSAIVPREFPSLVWSGGKECLEQIHRQRIRNYIWSFMYKRSFLESSGCRFPTDSRMLEDMVFLQDVLTRVSRVYYLNEKLYKYNINKNSLTHEVNPARAIEAYRAIAHCIDYSALDDYGIDYALDLLFFADSFLPLICNEKNLKLKKMIRHDIKCCIKKAKFRFLTKKNRIKTLAFQIGLYDFLMVVWKLLK